MNDDPKEALIAKGETALEILSKITPEPEPGSVRNFLSYVMDALERLNDQVDWLENMNRPAQEHKLAGQLAVQLNKTLEILETMDDGADTMIHQHYFMEQGVSLPQLKFGGGIIYANVQALESAVIAYQTHDTKKSSKLNPAKRKYMPLMFHVGQAWTKCFSGAAINANAGYPFFDFTDFLISEVVGDRHHRNESLIRMAKKDGLLP